MTHRDLAIESENSFWGVDNPNWVLLMTISAFVDSNPTGYEPRYVNRWP